MITRSSKEACFPQVVMDGEIQPFTALLNQPSLLAIAEEVMDQSEELVYIRRAIGLTNLNPGTDWFSVNGSAAQQAGIRIPSLEELGYDASQYRKSARIEVQCYAPTGLTATVELALIEYALNTRTPISGFAASKTIDPSGVDDFVTQANYQSLPDEAGVYQIDFRSVGGEAVRIRAYRIYLKIEKI
jgi:hypothetical protein